MSKKILKLATFFSLTALFLPSKCCYAQSYQATYESSTFKGKRDIGEVKIAISSKFISLNYGRNKPIYKNLPIMARINDRYILARDMQSRTSDLWIFQSKYKIVRVWSNQKTNSFGRITYLLIRHK